jgi:hypothetical protein
MVESKPTNFSQKLVKLRKRQTLWKTRISPGQTKEDDDEDRPVEEIESLCMSCGEQVRDRAGIGSGFAQRFGWLSPGCYEVAVDDDPVLQGGDHHVVQV